MPRFNFRLIAGAGGVALACLILPGCVSNDRTRLVSEPRCTDANFQIYFGEQSADISRAARRVIATTAAAAKSCKIAEVDVVGLADYRGDADANLTLSRQRAEAVAGALSKAGFPAPQFRVEAVGDTGAVTPKGQIEPLRRRADIYVRYAR